MNFILMTTSLKKGLDQISTPAGSFKNGITSFLAEVKLTLSILFINKSTTLAEVIALVLSQALVCSSRFFKCARRIGIFWLTYQTKSYQSRPLIRFCQGRHKMAWHLPANKSGA